jgi:hypothetical protein
MYYIREKKQIMVVTDYEKGLRYFEGSDPKSNLIR